VHVFDIAAILLTVAAVFGYLNHRLLKLPSTSGTLALALGSSLVLLAVEAVAPEIAGQRRIARFLADIDFNETLMRGLLSFLLFAGALHVDLEGLWRHKGTIATFATIGVLTSTLTIGILTWLIFPAIGIPVPLITALIFGALISPTDPIAVMGLLHEIRAPASLEAQIAGESLFNDGVGVVVFLGLLSVAAIPGAEGSHLDAGPAGLVVFFVREVVGGIVMGVALGFVGYLMLKSLDEHALELLITLALSTGVYALSFRLHVSGPIAVVVAGLLIGNPGRRFAMSAHTRERVDAFWSMIDYVLNAILFLLIGLEVVGVPQWPAALVAGLAAIPITLVGRAVSVALPVAALSRRAQFIRGIIPILTWSGLRGGLSVAMVLSLPETDSKPLLMSATYAVVVFSILVQGLTMRPVLIRYGVGR